jgi:lysozyme
MAVNIQKFLPSSKNVALAKVSQNIAKGSSSLGITESAQKNIGIISVKVIEIDKILKGTLASQKKQLDNQKRQQSSQRREKQEEKLETKPDAEKGKITMPKSPRLGIFDWIKNFIGNIILGYFAVRLVDHLPKIIPIVKFIGKATDFLIDVGGNLLNSLVTFIDWGYKAYDATRGFIKNIGGENFAKGFDKFIGAIDTALFLTTALAGSMAIEAMSGDDGGGLMDLLDIKKGAKAAKAAKGVTAAKAAGVGAAGAAAIVAGAGLLASALGEGAFQLKKFGNKGVESAKKAYEGEKNWLMKPVRWVGYQQARFANFTLGTIGALLDIVGTPFRYAIELIRYPFLSDEDKVKQANNLAKFDSRIREQFREGLNALTFGLAFKEKGSFGNIFGNEGAQKEMMSKMAGGGRPSTRGGKKQTGARRTISKSGRKGEYKRTIARKPGEVQISSPGADVGGEEKLFGLFPNPLKMAQKALDVINPFKVIQNAGNNLGKSDYFGPILAVTSKILLGQKPNQKDYENVGLGINLLISKGIDAGKLKGGVVAAFAEGGLVDPKALEAISEGGDISKWVADTFKQSTETNAQKTLREIQQNLKLKKDKEVETPPGVDGEEFEGEMKGIGVANASLNPHRKAFLDTLAYAEGTANYPNNGYTTMFTGKQFSGYRDHPRKIQVSGKYRSDAAGRYQFLSTTWDGLGLSDFSPSNQDIGALKLLAPHVLSAIDKGDFATAFHGARKTWASLPGAGYGQPEKNMKTLVAYANSRLEKYKKGQLGSSMVMDGKIGNIPGGVTSQKMQTGPSEYIGGSTAYHIDTKFHRSLGMGNMISSMDKLANAYASRGRKIEFSNAGVAGAVWDSSASSKAKSSLLQRAFDAHSHSSFMRKEGFLPIDYYIPKKDENRFGKSAEGADILLPTFGGKTSVGTKYGGYGKSAEISDASGKMVAMTGHGDIRYEKGGETLDGPHMAMIGEKGREIVIDNDSVESHPEIREMLLAINQASNYQGVLKAIQQYAPYDAMSPQTIIIPSSPINETPEDYSSQSSGGLAMFAGGETDDPFKTLYQGT